MKIVLSDKIYIQKMDLQYLIANSKDLPVSILENQKLEDIYNNPYDFIEFKNLEDINYIKKLSFLINYNDIKTMSNEDIKIFIKLIKTKQSNLLREYYSLSEKKENKKYNLLVLYKQLEYKISNIEKYLILLEEDKNLNLPLDINEKQTFKSYVKALFKRQK